MALGVAESLTSQITHVHPLGKEGTALQAHAVALAVVYGRTGAPNDFLAELRAFAAHDLSWPCA
jgi:ADP-ribosylglycohydrolase